MRSQTKLLYTVTRSLSKSFVKTQDYIWTADWFFEQIDCYNSPQQILHFNLQFTKHLVYT